MWNYLINEMLTPIILSLITTLITIKIDDFQKKKEKLPKFYIHSSIHGTKPKDDDWSENNLTVLSGFELERELNNEMLEFLKSNKFNLTFGGEGILGDIVEAYMDKKQNKENEWEYEIQINKILSIFKNNPKFLSLIKKYQKYQECSRFVLEIENIGETDAYGFRINTFKENTSGGKFYNTTLKSGEKRKFVLYYFDSSRTLDEQGIPSFWEDDITTIFYLIDKKKYKGKDEKLFYIIYNDKENKLHEIYCCAKTGKNERSITLRK